MPDLRLDSPLAFDRGIDRVVHERTPDALPQALNMSPSEMPQPAELDRLLALPNLDDYLQQALHPELDNKELLQPARFRQALEGAREALRQAAEASPEDAKALNRAARLLSEEGDLRDLLQMYRSMLLQG
jgi:type III secretion protein X